jgi:hypothetical protein
MKEFKTMPHGFLSYNFPVFGMRDEALVGIRASCDYLKELLGDDQKEEPLIQQNNQAI